MDEQEVKAAEEGTVTTDAAVTVDSEEVQGAPDTGDNGSGDSAAQQGNDAGVDNVNVEDEQQGNTADMEEQAVPTQPDDSTAAGHVDDHDDDHDDDDGDDANSGGGSGGGADNGSQQQDEASAVASASAEAVATDDAEDTNAQSQQSSSSIVGQAEARRAQALERLQLRKKRASEGGDGMAGGNEADGHETGSGSNNRGDTDDSSVFVANGHGADSTGHADGARQQHSNQQQQEGRGSRTGSVLSSSSGTNRSRTASTASGSGSPSIVVVQNKGPRGFMKWLSGTTDPQKQAALQQQRAAAQRRAQLLHEAEMETHRRQRANLVSRHS
ncbi:hypothetical protein PTSG_10611 [Salpingoeca rosetta]|uniref:Uncharacterized protein n=1 Tax=Salpingoeca rosetta (strain ATCC 50818 / BSB-021) TaxID=946362 RepID=F2URV2_SALR5|nr:uncharacterized protein PTSG_10611 [Salpingoeca rosetta]EGD80357.1 hypothetical protein PTSG_10611 [Salpingoeca rosetta]|eukprot:XP_004988147.1 hypothetical protein PTSG_10611 [Salpingoeca rosetta]